GTDSRYFQRISFLGDTLSLSTYDAGLQLYDRVEIVKTGDSRRLIDEGADIPEKIRVSDWFRANKSAKKVKKFEENIEKWRKNKP
ncbi:MAG: acid phosphatase, partial [Paludibacteraceae bacterium]|nr:acid phosphatase [Paludibacteraceae bacterium]